MMQAMIVADDEAGRRAALDELLPMQRADFEGMFDAMDGLPVTIRLLDPPIRFFHAAGLDYVSCSPFRVPIARVAAAQAAGL
jgi:phosphoenolpyruvate synthase/pyruvate phosphate dikinase